MTMAVLQESECASNQRRGLREKVPTCFDAFNDAVVTIPEHGRRLIPFVSS